MESIPADRPTDSPQIVALARLVFAAYWLVVCGSTIRKWIFPNLSVLYLMQDLPILLAYGYALRYGLYTRGAMMLGGCGMAVVLIFTALIQILLIGLTPFIAVAGLHHYLFYLPMLFVFPICFTERFCRDFVRLNLWLSLPMALLAIVQIKSPGSAWINHTTAGENTFGGFTGDAADLVRVIGTFNFTLHYSIWCGIAVALSLGEWLQPRSKRSIQSIPLLVAMTLATNICYLVSGSRIAIAHAALAFAGAFLAAILLRSTRSIVALGSIVLLAPLGLGLAYIASPKVIHGVEDRFVRYQENSNQRVEDAFVGFLTIPEFSILGKGLGLGVDAAHFGSVAYSSYTYQLSETDPIRNVFELGTPIGIFYVGMRILLASTMLVLAMGLTRDRYMPHVLPLAVTFYPTLYSEGITRSAPMVATQAFFVCALILGVGLQRARDRRSAFHSFSTSMRAA